MKRVWLGQIAAVIRLEMKKTFLARRGLWVYLLALAPVVIFMGHSIVEMAEQQDTRAIAQARPVDAAVLRGITNGMTIEEVVERAGEPHRSQVFQRRNVDIATYSYSDGEALYSFFFRDGVLQGRNVRRMDTISADTLAFATVFQYFFLRLIVFFGCVGVFMNLFRGEMLDKSLHFYLLAPLRREVLAVGKYLAGLIATVVIFTTSTGLQLTALLWHQPSSEISAYLSGPGWGHVAAYLGVTVAACVGYGSVFLAAGMLFRNPIIPTAVVLVWEGANLFLPATLKKISVIYYLQSMCPVVAPPNEDVPFLRMLITAAEPVSAPVAILGLAAVTGVVLFLAGRQARRLEINYGAE